MNLLSWTWSLGATDLVGPCFGLFHTSALRWGEPFRIVRRLVQADQVPPGPKQARAMTIQK